MKRLIQLLAIVMILPISTQAQDLVDALRYSSFQVQGTARAGGMGNAFGALGADFTSVSINPAGLGIYRAGEFVITPSFDQTQVESNYLNNVMSDKNYNFSINNLSYVATIPTQRTSESGIVSVNFGIGYNRLKDFNSEILVGANSVESSFLDNLIENANGEDPNEGWSPFYEELAYYDEETNSGTDLIYEENGFWRSDLQQNPFDENVNNYPHYQRKSISKQGSIDEFSLALGLNFNHKLYMGVSVGIVDIYYKENSRLIEKDVNNNINRFNELEFDSYLRTTGTGYNGKIGIIYKPINEVRLGASIHTPTFYNLRDIFETYMYSSNTFEDAGLIEDEANSPYSEYDYDIETPMRATFSGAFVIAKKGLLSIDYELVDYGSASLRRGGDGYDFVDENSDIAEAYKAVGNLRVGGEYRATDNISLRAGIENYPSAYNDQAFGSAQKNADASLQIYSAGLGYRSGGFYFDVAYRYADKDEYDYLYAAPSTDIYPEPQMAQFNSVKNKVLFTLGFKF